MFTLYSSAKIEALLTNLKTVIETQPLSSPFAQDVFLVQQPGMERWLSQQLAAHFNVWANYQFLTPTVFFKTLAHKIGHSLNNTALDSDTLPWRIESLLRDDLSNNVFIPLQHYLNDEQSEIKRYQLARTLAQLFDQYLIVRPDMIVAWQQNQLLYHTEAEQWQKALWQHISIPLAGQDKNELWRDVLNTLNQMPSDAFSKRLPERIFVFGVHHLAPTLLDFLQGLARHCPVHFFLFNPIPQNATVYPPILLTRLDQQGREFLDLLAERGLLKNTVYPSYCTENPSTLLHHLQNDLLTNTQTTRVLSRDDSISVHACHSRMREVEVLRNLLLARLEQHPDLELRDIIVMSPDIQQYVPFIAAVFHDIQHTIADQSPQTTQPALTALIDFLQLSQSRFGWKSVLDLLERPFIYPGFDLSDSDLDLIKHWLADTRVRWGKSSEHRHDLGVYPCADNTWQAALNSLLMGYAVGDDSEFIDSILPYRDIEGSSANALGGLHDFIQLLFDASTRLVQPRPLLEWGQILSDYAEQLLPAADSNDRQALNERLLELSSTPPEIHQDSVSLKVILLWLQDQANTPTQRHASNGFLRGQLTFCTMQPMRTLPFKVIALLGMNEGDFPRLDQRPTFDLTTLEHRKGDSSKRSSDRYHFLEILLSVRQQLLITYIGQSINQNNRIAPAIVVSELLEVLRDNYQIDDLITYHPLHAFSPRYFTGQPDLFSYSEADCVTARALLQPKKEQALWWQGELAPQTETVIALSELFRFFQHPQRYFLRRQLDVRLQSLEAEPEEREDFALNALDRYASLNQGLQASLQGQKMSVDKLQAQGRWLSGVMGTLEAERQTEVIAHFVARIQALELGDKQEDLAIDISVGDYRLVGTLGHCYQNGALLYRYATLKGKDFLCMLLHHLIANCVQPQTTYLLSADDERVLLPAHCQAHYLPLLLTIFQHGQQRPDAFFVEAALAYIQQAAKSGPTAQEQALEKAKIHLNKALAQPHELELQRLFGTAKELDGLLGNDFEQVCCEVLLPLWQASDTLVYEN